VHNIQKHQARELYLKSKIYRFFAILFAGVGLLVFANIYFVFSDGNFFKAISDPFFIVLIIFPFVPTIILSMMATRYERKLADFFKQSE
jgi:O-antigen/teichoic acid export membrane protein